MHNSVSALLAKKVFVLVATCGTVADKSGWQVHGGYVEAITLLGDPLVVAAA
jgi:hypothetical protein